MFNKIDEVGQDFLDHLRQQGQPLDPNRPNDPKPTGDPNIQDPSSNPEKPIERQPPSKGPEVPGNPDNPYQPPQQPGSLTPPSPEAFHKTSNPMPQEPTPVAASPAQPFAPLPQPSPMDMVKSQQFDQLGKGSLLGGAGGLLGGGLNTSGLQGGGDSSAPSDNLLPLLLQLLSKQ